MSQFTNRNSAQRERDRQTIRRSGAGCHICGKPIDYSLKSPHPLSFEVDHLVPLSKGGADNLSNKRAAHRLCNGRKSDLLPADADRRVVLVCGPPGAGKTTFAHTLGLEVYDLDDDKWRANDTLFRAALIQEVRENPKARAVVIRSGASLSARRRAVSTAGATECIVIETDLATCLERIKRRGRTEPPLRFQIQGARQWWARYEPGDVTMAYTGGRLSRSGSLA